MTDFKLKYLIDGDSRPLKNEMAGVDRMFQQFHTSAGVNFSSVAAGAGIAAGGVLAIGGAALTATRMLFDLSKQAADFGSTIFDASQKTGLTAESLSAMKFAADQSGSSLEQLESGVAKFAKTVGGAADGSKEAAAKLKDLGLSPQEALNDLDGALGKVFKRISEAKPGIEQITLAQKAFGKSGADLIPFIRSFDGDLEALTRRAKELGVTIDDEAAQAADEFGDALDTLSAQFAAIGRSIGTAFMPQFLEMAQATSKWAIENKSEITNWAAGTSIAIQAVINKIGGLVAEAQKWRAASDFLWLATQPADIFIRATGLASEVERLAKKPKASLGGVVSPLIGGGRDTETEIAKRATRAGGSSDSRTDKQAYQDFVKELKKLGVTINSGFRTEPQQRALYNRLPRGQAAYPGTSDHEFWKAVDLPPGVSQKLIERAARAADVTLSKRNVHQGTGLHNHQAFRKGRTAGSEGGGEEDLAKEQADQLRDQQQAMDDRLRLRRQEADLAAEILREQLDLDMISETEHAKRISELRIDILQDERNELAGQVSSRENINRLEEIDLQLTKEQLILRRELREITEKEQNDRTSLMIQQFEAENKLWQIGQKQLKTLEQQNEERREVTRLTFQQMLGKDSGPIQSNKGAFQEGFLDQIGFDADMEDTLANRAKLVSQTFNDLGSMVGNAAGQMAQGVGAMVEQWVLYGSAGPDALRKMTASVLGSLAAQATVEAIMQLARGFAALANPFSAWQAPLHFKSAALFGIVAAGSALAGRAIAGDSFSKSGGSSSGSKSGRSSGSGSAASEKPLPMSRYNDNTYISGRREDTNPIVAEAILKLEKKLDSMKPGDVITVGARENPSAFARGTVNGMRGNASYGTQFRRATGGR